MEVERSMSNELSRAVSELRPPLTELAASLADQPSAANGTGSEKSLSRFIAKYCTKKVAVAFAINSFIVVYLFAVFAWTCPFPSTYLRSINETTGPVMRCFGMWQSWDMFAPEPKSIQTRLDATLVMRDGTTRQWVFFKDGGVGVFERMRQERNRKWGHDNVRLDMKSGLWEPTALFIARQFVEPENIPVEIELHRHWADIAPPDAPDAGQTRPWKRYTFYRRNIRPEDVR